MTEILKFVSPLLEGRMLGGLLVAFLIIIYFFIRKIKQDKASIAQIKTETVALEKLNEYQVEALQALAEKFNINKQLDKIPQKDRVNYLFQHLSLQEQQIKHSETKYLILLFFTLGFFLILILAYFYHPTPLSDKEISQAKEDERIQKVINSLDTCKLHIVIANFKDENNELSISGTKLASKIEDNFDDFFFQITGMKKLLNPVLRINEFVDKHNYSVIAEKYKADILVFGNICNSSDSLGTVSYCTNTYLRQHPHFFRENDIIALNTLEGNKNFKIPKLLSENAARYFNYLIGYLFLNGNKCVTDDINYDTAYSYLKKAYTEMRSNSNYDNNIVYWYSYSLIGIADYEQAIALSEELLQKSDNEELNLQVLVNLTFLYPLFNNMDRAKYHYKHGLKLAHRLKNYSMVCQFHNEIGTGYINNGENDSAFVYYNKGVYAHKKTNLSGSEDLGVAYNGLGLFYQRKGVCDSSIFYYHKGLRHRKSQRNISSSYNNIGTYYIDTCTYNVDSAFYYLNKSLSISIELGDKMEIARAYFNIAGIYFEEKEYDKALINFKKSIPFLKEIGINGLISDGYRSIVGCYRMLEDIDSANYYINIAKQYENKT